MITSGAVRCCTDPREEEVDSSDGSLLGVRALAARLREEKEKEKEKEKGKERREKGGSGGSGNTGKNSRSSSNSSSSSSSISSSSNSAAADEERARLIDRALLQHVRAALASSERDNAEGGSGDLVLSASDAFGERALLNDAPRAATVWALTRVSCLCLGRHAFKTLLGPLGAALESNLAAKVCLSFFLSLSLSI